MSLRIAICTLVILASSDLFAESINERIIRFCKENLGKSVGDGDCYDLAQFALKYGRARPQYLFGVHPDKDDYVWGKLIVRYQIEEDELQIQGNIESLQPGDVIQFRDVHFQGPPPSGIGYYYQKFDHHTAIIESVSQESDAIHIFHQNYDGRTDVMQETIRLKHLQKGWIRIYRPQRKRRR